MDLNQVLRNHASQPLTHQLLMSLLKDYKRPNDKVHELLSQHILEPIKKGLYIAGPSLETVSPEPFLVANHILGPSYISSDSALSYHGLIPERVYEISSMTIKASRKFTTSLGSFTYRYLPLPYYSFGIQQAVLSKNQYVMIASPEKALFDKVTTTSGILLRSQKSVADYLIDDLRINEENLKNLDSKAMRLWLPNALKKESLLVIIKFIDSL
ncbi:MAG: hypothetical protein EOP45_08330 [Sphingobacteriaceae bacterium]|nr:MAG: hypothetical protein EOP45_08330 [Sphingobacteriaceae bacterium]